MLGDIRSWLLDRGVPEEQAELAIGNIVGFYGPYVLGLFQRILNVGVTGGEVKSGRPDIRLHFCWPEDLISNPSLRRSYESKLLKIFSREVGRPSKPYLSIKLEFLESDSNSEADEAFFEDVARQSGRQSLGVLSSDCLQERR